MIDNTFIFHSDIKNTEVLQDSRPLIPSYRFDDLMDELLEGPYLIADILPCQVPAGSGGQYFSMERYFLQPERISTLRRRFAEILLRLNCYFDMAVSFDSCRTWELNPDPEGFAAMLESLSGNCFLRALFEEQRMMIDIEHDNTYMTVYGKDPRLLDKLRALASAEGLFVWSPPESEGET